MRLPVWFGTSALLFLLSTVYVDEPAKPRKLTKETVNVPYSGTVTEVTKDSITVQWPGEQAKKFAVSDVLAAGKVPKEPRSHASQKQPYLVPPSRQYRLTDVAVGDQVLIIYAHIGGTDICDHICIQKRPNGLVPPLPEGAEVLPRRLPPGFKEKNPTLFIPYHEWMNAYWDLEDRGIPYPEKFGSKRRWPAAPMPREK